VDESGIIRAEIGNAMRGAPYVIPPRNSSSTSVISQNVVDITLVFS
jgi:hypothetical protein